METTFKKRIYDVKTFYKLLEDLIKNFKDLRNANKNKKISNAFRDRILLAVTQVNGCRYCSYHHTKHALKSGMSEDEVKNLLEGELSSVPADEFTAMLFAQQYAETKGSFDPEAYQKLLDTYGVEKTRDIMAYIRAIMVANVHGIMIDVLKGRLTRKPDPASSLWKEISIVFGMFFYIPVIVMKKVFTSIT